MSSQKKRTGSFGVVISIIAIVIVIFSFCSKKRHTQQQAATPNENVSVAEGSYSLIFGDSFNRALASQDDLGLSILIAVDVSGSMKDYPSEKGNRAQEKYKIASESLNEIVTFLSEFYSENIVDQGITLKLGLMKFSDSVTEIYPLTEMNNQRFEELRRLTSNRNLFLPEGATAIGKTLETGSEILAQSGTIFNSLIIITDGENTTGIEPAPVLSAIVENKNNKSTPDFPVFTNDILVSFVAFDIALNYFNRLETIGARITSAGNKAELNESLKNLFLADITKLEGN